MTCPYNPFLPTFSEAQDWNAIDYRYGLPDDQRIERLATAMDTIHMSQQDDTASWRRRDNRILGLKGERAFARIFGCHMDLKLKKYGNNRRNFVLANGARIDVVTRRMKYDNDAWFPDLTIRHRAKSRSQMVLYLIVWGADSVEPYHAGWIAEQEAHRVGKIEQYREGIVNTVVSIGQLFDPRRLLEQHNPNSQWLHCEYPVMPEIAEATRENDITQRGLF